MSEKRHPCVLNVADAPARSAEKGRRFGFQSKNLGQATGGVGIGASWYEVQPGRAAFPAHFHCATEEAIFVLEGEGTLRIGSEKVLVRSGDYVTFPVGPDHAHQLLNTGTTPLRYLCLSTRPQADVVGYPDSKKVGAVGVPGGWKFPQPAWIRVICKADSAIDYYEGEEVD